MANTEVEAGNLAPIGSQDIKKIPEQNTHWQYLWMLNAKGVKVPVPVIYVADALKRQYTHTDKVIYEDKAENNVRFGKENDTPVTPEERMAEAVEKLAQSQEATAQILENVTGTEIKKRKKTKEEVTE